MTKYALIVNGIVHSTPEYNERPEFAPNIVLIELPAGLSVQPGWGFVDGEFVEPDPEPLPVPTSDDVDAERDRRISAGFDFQGNHYQSRLPNANQAGDWDVFNGKALEAFIAISSGAEPGDLRWSDPEADFAWIASDNSRVPMDAHTIIALGRAASVHRSRQTFAGSDIKAMQPIPHDYSNDEWWPA